MATIGRVDSGHNRPAVSSEILDRLPPQNLDAERAVLGSLLLDAAMCDDVMLILRPEDFYSDVNRKLYGHIVAMHDEGSRVDTMLLVERLKQAGDYDAVGGAPHLAEVLQAVAVAAHAAYYARIVREKATLRALIHASTEILRDAYDPTLDPRDMISGAEEKIFAIHEQRTTDQLASMHDVLVQAFAHIDKRMEQGGATGTPTGFADLDSMTGGLHESELIILAARPSMGKTAMATNIADHISVDSSMCTLFVSLEMSRLELAQRMLCSRGEINGKKFRGSFLSGEDRDKLVEASAKLSKAPLFIDDTPSRTVAEISAAARRLKRRANLALIVIDYLQLIEPDNSKDPRQEQVAKIARRLKGLARELGVPVLCLAQLNRQAEASKDNRPRLSHLRESGAIEQDADVVMFVHREEYYYSREEAQERNLVGQAEVIVAKQRNGPTGEVKLHWFQDFTKFKNATQKAYDEFEQFGDF